MEGKGRTRRREERGREEETQKERERERLWKFKTIATFLKPRLCLHNVVSDDWVANSKPGHYSILKHGILVAQIFAHVGLVKGNNRSGFELARIRRRPRRDTKPLHVSRLSEPRQRTNGRSFMLNITTPWCSGVSSVMRPTCALTMLLP